MIERYLYANYTLYVQKNRKGQVRGNFVKKTNNIIIDYAECRTDHLRILNLLPEVQECLNDNKSIRVNYAIEDRTVRAQIGEEQTSGPYCEECCYKIESEAEGVDIFDAFMNLNTSIASKKREAFLSKSKKIRRRK